MNALVCGFQMGIRDIDSRMWDEDFSGLAKCRQCGFRTDFTASKSEYKPPKAAPDVGVTWDNADIVSAGFVEFCGLNHLDGFEVRAFRHSRSHFHFVPSRSVAVDRSLSDFECHAPCKLCGNPEWQVTNGNLMYLSIQKPISDGFWATDILLGSGNTKGHSIIVNHRTKELLQTSGLKGFLRFVPVYAESTPALEAALKTYPPIQPVRFKRPKMPRAVPSRLDLEPFINLLADAAPAFRCEASGQPKRRTTIALKHELGGQPSSAALGIAREQLGRHGKLLLDFYKHNDGVALYRDLHSDEAGVRLFPIARWVAETAAMKKVFASIAKKQRPEVLSRAVAFGEPPSTGHHFAIITKGEGAGSILLTNHETLSADEFAPDFNEFLKIICTDPVDLLVNQLGCYVRYRDGKTNQEWIPEAYFPDANKSGRKKSGK